MSLLSAYDQPFFNPETIGAFRRSLGTLLGQKVEDLKVVQEFLRHSSSKITADVYQQANTKAKRSALDRVAGIFVVPAKAT